MTNLNPLHRLTEEWLPIFDFGVLSHGFLAHGRDYGLIVQVHGLGTYRLVLTHVPLARYETVIASEVWTGSWSDVFLDWEKSKDLNGYSWATNWSLAYPGLTFLDADSDVDEWSRRFKRPMHGVVLETDRFKLKLIFNDAYGEQISTDAGLVDQVINPL
jgi:hypothetical protein